MNAWICRECKLQKPEAEFVRMASRPSLRWCRACKSSYDARYYERTKPRRTERKRVTVPQLRQRNREYVWGVLANSGGCMDCGISDVIVLEFDHRDRSAKFHTVVELITEQYSLAKIAAEIAKCDVVCANCHRRRTADQMGWTKDIQAAV